MKASTTVLAVFSLLAFACTNNNRTDSNTSSEGTIQTNRVNSDMDDNRTAADIDTIVSPGSNALDKRDQNNGQSADAAIDNSDVSASPAQGSGNDPNMKGQSDTHGKKTTAGDK